MVLRNDGQEELSPPIWCSSRGTQSPKACVNTPEGATAWFGPNPPQKHIIQVDQTDPLKTFLKGEPQTLGVAQILIGLMKVCLFAIGLCFYSSGFSYRCHSLTMVSGYLIWGSLFVKTHQAEWILPCLVLRIGSCVYCCWEKDDIKPEGIRDCDISPLPAGSQHHYLSFCVWVQGDLLCHTGGGYPANQ
ncbi:uncharacterized protein LOC103661311 isoform X5 [Ursus maritimus]|uniref:Uncharacterized protein LOC103661311 isoform X5 n=1 Tax=Ursus maritimus TaxID=29073 RepID=A0A8M1GHE5_URSMA|nr:uncharacterized protein LOC103661311 isoform X5 [Ursus maritimus]